MAANRLQSVANSSIYLHTEQAFPEITFDQEENIRHSAAVHAPIPVVEPSGGADERPESGTNQTKPDSAESFGENIFPPPAVGKPQVIVRIRPSPVIDSTPTFEVDQQTKTIQIRVDRDRKAQELGKHKPPPGFIYFPADNVLENSSQEDTFTAVAEELVEKAMLGIPGMIVAIGPEVSGKSFSLFGLSGRYRNRGIVARTLERMFEIKDRRQEETDFKFGMSIIEVRRERVRDLLTLSPNELNDVGDRGPRGMYTEEVDCMEHGLGLLLRALIGQKLIHQEPYEKYHTIVYLEIVGVSPLAPELVQLQSRITLAEIASAPYRSDGASSSPGSNSLFYGPNPDYCAPPPQVRPDLRFKSKQAVFPARKCSNPGYTTGPLAESIAVRRDVFALEQIFLKANEMYRIRKYFAKLEHLGLSMIASEKRRIASGRNFRQNRLAHCLKDILDTNTEIRILLHVRPDKAYLKSSLESMRFAERARLVPCNLDDDPNKGKPNRTEDQILQEVINDIAPELMHPSNVENLNSEKMKVIQEQAVQYFENNIDAMKVCSKDKVKLMFENFRVLWNFLWELELNVTLRKAEEDMKVAMEKMGIATSATETVRHGSDGGKNQGSGNGDVEEESIVKEQTKKSSKKNKKEKERKKKKDKHQDKQKRTSSNDLHHLSANDPKGKRASTMSETDENHTQRAGRKSSYIFPDGIGEDGTDIKGEVDVINTSPPSTTEQEVVTSLPVVKEGIEAPPQSKSRASSIVVRPSKDSNKRDQDANLGDGLGADDNKNDGTAIRFGENADRPSLSNERPSFDKNVSADPHSASGPQPPLSGTPHINYSPLRHNSTFFVRGGFADFKLHNVWSPGHGADPRFLTEEERQLMAAELEQQISNNFEEMKKVARRQAIHLLRTGVRRPQWLSLF